MTGCQKEKSETRNPRTFTKSSLASSRYERDIPRKGNVLSVGNEEGARGAWAEARCNSIEGKDPGTLSIGLTKADDLLLYFPNLCRKIPFRYQKTVEHKGAEAFRFSPIEQTFHNPQFEPDNSCYCHGPSCLPSGVFDLGVGCPYPQAGNPVYMSWPHFLHGDSILTEAVDGLTPPDVNNHSLSWTSSLNGESHSRPKQDSSSTCSWN